MDRKDSVPFVRIIAWIIFWIIGFFVFINSEYDQVPLIIFVIVANYFLLSSKIGRIIKTIDVLNDIYAKTLDKRFDHIETELTAIKSRTPLKEWDE